MINDITVEIWNAWINDWVDITRIDEYTRVLADDDGAMAITMTAGGGDLSPALPPRSIVFRMIDSNGVLDWDNPASPLHRRIGIGTPVRVKLDGVVQQIGEIAATPVSWDDGGRHADGTRMVITEVSCTDMWDRLGQNEPPLESALTTYYRRQSTDMLFWWPFEERPGATRVEAARGGVALIGIGPFGNTDGPPGATTALQQRYEARAAPVPDLSTALESASELTPFSYYGDDWTVEVSGKFPAVAVDDDTAPAVLVEWRTHGLSGYWQIRADYVSKCWELRFFNNSLSQFTITTSVLARDDEWHMVRVSVTHAAPNFDVDMWVDGLVAGTFPVTGATTSPPKSVTIDNFEDVDGSIRPAISHLTIWAGTEADGRVPAPDEPYRAMTGYAGEISDERITRLAQEGGIGRVFDGTALAGYTLGAQGADSLLRILEATAESDESWVFAHRTESNTVYHLHRTAMYNQAPVWTGTYAHISPSFRPNPDRSGLANSITVSSADSEASFTIPDDDLLHWTTRTPPDGAYRRPESATVNSDDPSNLIHLAAWKAHVRAWKQKRYTAVTLDLARAPFTEADIAAVRSIDLGKMIAFDTTGAPPQVTYNEIRGIVRGWTRELSRFNDRWTFNTLPADIWEVEVPDAGNSTLVYAIDDNDTAAKFATQIGPLWTSLTPFRVAIDGDPVDVTNISRDTPAYGAAGAASHADNAAVSPALPAGITANVGQSLWCFAAHRNTAGTLATPAGWTAVDIGYTHLALFHKYHVTGDTAPTVTPSGGAAGDTISAFCWYTTGTSRHPDATGTTDDFSGGLYGLSQGSAVQNITFPRAPVRTARTVGLRENGVMQFALAWKQDDSTSVAAPSGFTQIVHGSTTTGNDQTIYAAYRITATPTGHTSAAVTVAGGATAISKAVIFAARPLQTVTITRGIAGVAVSHVAGVDSPVTAWRMGVAAL